MSTNKKEYDKKDFWRSIKDYYDDPVVLQKKADEFNEGATDEFEPSKLSRMSRRNFLSLIAASAAFTATACSDYRDKGEIVPYTKRPEEVLPGIADYYASSCTGCSQNCGILIKTREGRPVKVDGNPEHPVNKGKICAIGQAGILNLYDPERLKYPLKNGRKSEWEDVRKSIIDLLNSSLKENKRIALLSDPVNSPTLKKLFGDFKNKYPNTDIIEYIQADNKTRTEAWRECFGTDVLPKIRFDKAKVILSLESDFLAREGETIENAGMYARGRNVDDKDNFSRMYAVEGSFSLTGSNADYRIRMRPDIQHEFVLALISEIDKYSKNDLLVFGDLWEVIAQNDLKRFIETNKLDEKIITGLVKDLIDNAGNAVVYAGDIHSKEMHSAVNLLNELLGTENIYDFNNGIPLNDGQSADSDIQEYINKLNNQDYSVVIHFGTNPVFNLAAGFKYSEALKNAGSVVTLTESENESSSLSNFVIPTNHNYESWGDYKSRNNVISYQQPVIDPLFDSRQKESVLLDWIREGKYEKDNYHKYLKKNSPFSSEKTWFKALEEGFVVNETKSDSNLKFNKEAEISTNPAIESDKYLLTLSKSYFIGDGRFASNGWLQELPHPVTKVTWDNYAAVAPSTADELGVQNDDLLEISSNGSKLKIAVMVQPGMAEKQIDIELGYGRSVISDSGKNSGFNANVLLGTRMSSNRILQGVKVSKAEGKYKLVSTQEHHAVDDSRVKDFHKIRHIIQEGTLEEYHNDPEFLNKEKENIFSITDSHKYKDVKWGMAIDLNKCISCSVCVASCNVENNVPVVGKDQVANGREMQWIRIDRYYSGTPEIPEVSNQPMLCQHCDNAPCENVCPVAATNHSPDGLNQMVYNRCVGTRYCSNNCPYKVRRFNFFNFRDHFADAYYQNEVTDLVHNPEVTVRSRGVMEKCTFCIQRIMEARQEAIKEGREIKGTDVTTACQQACPTEAITFGDLNDKESKLVKLREHNLGYHVLEELNVKPNVTYIAKLRNTSREVE